MCIQIDLHPFMTRNDVVKYCQEPEHEIALEVSISFIRRNKTHLM